MVSSQGSLSLLLLLSSAIPTFAGAHILPRSVLASSAPTTTTTYTTWSGSLCSLVPLTSSFPVSPGIYHTSGYEVLCGSVTVTTPLSSAAPYSSSQAPAQSSQAPAQSSQAPVGSSQAPASQPAPSSQPVAGSSFPDQSSNPYQSSAAGASTSQPQQSSQPAQSGSASGPASGPASGSASGPAGSSSSNPYQSRSVSQSGSIIGGSNSSRFDSASYSASGSSSNPYQSKSVGVSSSASRSAQPGSRSASSGPSSSQPASSSSGAAPGQSSKPPANSGSPSSSGPISSAPTTTYPVPVFTSSASSASSQLAVLFPVIIGWIDNPGTKIDVLDDIDNIKSEIEDLIKDSGVKSGGCPPAKRKRADPWKRDIIGDIVGTIVGTLECAVDDLTKIEDAINNDDTSEIQDLVDDLTDLNDDVGEDLDDNDDNNSSKDDNSSKDQSSTSGSYSESSSGSCSASAVMHVTSDCARITIRSGSSSTVETTCTSSTTVETTGCSLSPSTTTVWASSSSGPAQPPCEPGNCGGSCNTGGGPLTAAMVVEGSDDCASVPTMTVASLPEASYGVWSGDGGASGAAPAPSAAASAPAKRSNPWEVPQQAANESEWLDLEKRTLSIPSDPQAYVTGLSDTLDGSGGWISQGVPTAGTWFPFDTENIQIAGVNGIYGCTSVMVISQKGAYISHIWEGPAFIEENPLGSGQYYYTPDDQFYSQTSSAMLSGNALTPSLANLAASGGPLSSQYNPQVIVVTPRDTSYGNRVDGFLSPYVYHQRAYGLGDNVAKGLGLSTEGVKVMYYTRTNKDISTSSGYLGRAIVEYDPLQGFATRRKTATTPQRSVQISKWRLWVEDYLFAEQQFYTYAGSTTNAKRQAAACPVPSGLPPASVSSSASASVSQSLAPSASGGASSSQAPGSSSFASFSVSSSTGTAPSSSAPAPGSSSFASFSVSSNASVPSSSAAPSGFSSFASFSAAPSNFSSFTSFSAGSSGFSTFVSSSAPALPPASSSFASFSASSFASFSAFPSASFLPSASSSFSGSALPPTASSTPLSACPKVNAPVCQTSDGSPLVSDCQNLNVPSNVQLCAQQFGSGCQTVHNSGTCNLVLCQDDSLVEVQCLNPSPCIETWVNELIDTCGSNGNVGGYITIPGSDGNYINLEFTHS